MAETFDHLVHRYPSLASCKKDIETSAVKLWASFERQGKLLVCGNGGSSADAGHIATELLKSFKRKRPLRSPSAEKLKGLKNAEGLDLIMGLEGALPCISLSAHQSFLTAHSNDVDAQMVFAQQIVAYGNDEDCLLAISTSGNSSNVLNAVITANALGLTTIGLSGKTGGRLKNLCTHCICVEATETAEIQELHLPVYHAICAYLEEKIFFA